MIPGPLFVGIDLGTSGCRALAIDGDLQPIAAATVSLTAPPRRDACSEQDAEAWWDAVDKVMAQLTGQIDPAAIDAITVDGTSGSIVLCDTQGTPVMPALLYNDARAGNEAVHRHWLRIPEPSVARAIC